MNKLLIFLLSCVVVVDLYLAEHSTMKRPEIFYAVAALMLFAALVMER